MTDTDPGATGGADLLRLQARVADWLADHPKGEAFALVADIWALVRRDAPGASRDLCARIFHAVHEADRTAIKREDAQSGFVSFYTLPTGPWHKIIALVRELPVSEADLLPYLSPPPDEPMRAAAPPAEEGPITEAWPGQMENSVRGIIRHASWSEARKIKELLALLPRQGRGALSAELIASWHEVLGLIVCRNRNPEDTRAVSGFWKLMNDHVQALAAMGDGAGA